ncbi:helix-turn-helix domain-containing protein [Vibrio sp. PP-XX7]
MILQGQKPDVFAAPCPSREILKHISSRWGMLILLSLQDGTHRFSELRRRIGGISEKMLAQTLQVLADDGLVQRTAYPVVPPMWNMHSPHWEKAQHSASKPSSTGLNRT